MNKHAKKLQIFLMFLIGCLVFSSLLLFSLSSSIEKKNDTIQRLNDELISNSAIATSLDRYNEIIAQLKSKLLKLESQNAESRRDLSMLSETLVEKNLTINQLKQKLTSEQRKLARYKSNYNKKMKSQLANEQRMLNSKLEQERLALQFQEDELEKQRSELEKLRSIPPAKKTISIADKKAIDEERVEALMKKFDSYQVDLSVENQCDKAYLYRYNEAKSTLNHIRTYLQKNQMNSSYYHFVIANDSSITAQNRQLCLDD